MFDVDGRAGGVALAWRALLIPGWLLACTAIFTGVSRKYVVSEDDVKQAALLRRLWISFAAGGGSPGGLPAFSSGETPASDAYVSRGLHCACSQTGAPLPPGPTMVVGPRPTLTRLHRGVCRPDGRAHHKDERRACDELGGRRVFHAARARHLAAVLVGKLGHRPSPGFHTTILSDSHA